MPFSPLFLFGQNLIPNPSFEDTIQCPHSTNQVDRALGWYPSRNSPDYFNECDWINGSLSVPDNFQGYQYAHTGNAYCGIIAFSHNDQNYREDFTCQLLSSLIIGRRYNISFYYSWAGLLRIACNRVGILLSTNNYSVNNNAPICNCSQVFANIINTDSVNWTFIQQSFVADSAYEYLTFGNFFDSSFVDTIRYFPSSTAYYYVDDISLVEDSEVGLHELPPPLIEIYPNPFESTFNIKSSRDKFSRIDLINSSGQIVFCQALTEPKMEIDISLVENSKTFYYLRIYFTTGTIAYYKLLKI